MTPLAQQRAWSLFDVRAIAARRLTPNMVRVTLAADTPDNSPQDAQDGSHQDVGQDTEKTGRTPLVHFADHGFDQRIKVIVPARPGADVPLSDPDHWYRDLRALPDGDRPAARTYTVRSMRHVGRPHAEIDVDIVLHGTGSPASAWAASALADVAAGRPADLSRVTLVGPDSRFDGDPGGRTFVTTVAHDLLIAGDETALPAIAAILERLDRSSTGTVMIEVPTEYDVIPLNAPPGVHVTFLPREGREHGAPLTASALAWRPSLDTPTGHERSDKRCGAIDAQSRMQWDERAWDVPDAGSGLRAWVAGEAGAVRTIRRHLVGPCSLARDEVAFMGYWRLGRSEN